MAEHKAVHAPVGNLLRARQDTVCRQIIEAALPVFVAVPAAHAVTRIRTFIAFIARKHIQIRSVKRNVVFKQTVKIALYIIKCLRCAQIGLRPARPFCMGIMASVHALHCIFFLIGGCIMIIVTVLVMNPEVTADLMHRLCQGPHAVPAAGLLTGRKIIRMTIVIARLCPAIQMKIHLSCSLLMKPANHFLPVRKRSQTAVFLRMLMIIKFRCRIRA